jgi:hypothetical protein
MMPTDMQPQPLRPPLSGVPQLSPAIPLASPAGGNPIVQEIDQAHAALSPQAKQAIEGAHGLLGLSPGDTAQNVEKSAPSVAPSAGPSIAPAAPVPAGPSLSPEFQSSSDASAMPNMVSGGAPGLSPGSPSSHPKADEYQRILGSGSGISQIHNPFLKGLATVGDALGQFFPRVSAVIPGTTAHHQLVEGEAGRAAGEESAQEKQADALKTADVERGLKTAQTQNQEAIPELKKTAGELAREKQQEVERANQAKEENARTIAAGKTQSAEEIAKEKHRSTLAQHGFEENEKGEIVPLSYEKMSEPQQAVHDLKAAQSEAAEATAALKKAQAANQPAAAALAQKRLQSAQEAHGIALRRLNLSEKQFEMRAHGTEGGEALPGAMLNDENKPVGTAFQQNVRPTGQERNKADLANSAHEQLQDIKGIVAKRPDIFGPLAGRTTDFKVWLGSQDPDAQRFRAARTIAGDHLAGVFGGRSEAALSALDSAIGHFKDNPAAMQAGLDQLDKANRSFQKAGSVKTQGSDAGKAATADPHVKAYADKYFGGDLAKAQAAIDSQKAKK